MYYYEMTMPRKLELLFHLFNRCLLSVSAPIQYQQTIGCIHWYFSSDYFSTLSGPGAADRVGAAGIFGSCVPIAISVYISPYKLREYVIWKSQELIIKT